MRSTPARVGLRAAALRRDGQSALEVVDERQQLQEQILGGRPRELRALALDPPSVVVELGRLPQQQVAVFVTFRRRVRGGLGLVGGNGWRVGSLVVSRCGFRVVCHGP